MKCIVSKIEVLCVGSHAPAALSRRAQRRHEESGYVLELALNVSGELNRERRDRYALRLLAVDGRASDSADQRHTATATLNGAHSLITSRVDLA